LGKRSQFARNPRDYYPTPQAAVKPLLPWLSPGTLFTEPCAGDGRLIRHLEAEGHICIAASDLEPRAPEIKQHDARTIIIEDNRGIVVTNCPWDRALLHPIIDNLSRQITCWFLLDADWLHTRQANGYWQRCVLVVSVGRVKWIEGSKHTGKDNCCWLRFDPGHKGGPHFIGRS
jgi:hypothetical protein